MAKKKATKKAAPKKAGKTAAAKPAAAARHFVKVLMTLTPHLFRFAARTRENGFGTIVIALLHRF